MKQMKCFHVVSKLKFKTSLNFVDHVSEIFAFILKGLPVCVIKPEKLLNPIELIETINEFKITYFVLVPSLLKNCHPAPPIGDKNTAILIPKCSV